MITWLLSRLLVPALKRLPRNYKPSCLRPTPVNSVTCMFVSAYLVIQRYGPLHLLCSVMLDAYSRNCVCSSLPLFLFLSVFAVVRLLLFPSGIWLVLQGTRLPTNRNLCVSLSVRTHYIASNNHPRYWGHVFHWFSGTKEVSSTLTRMNLDKFM